MRTRIYWAFLGLFFVSQTAWAGGLGIAPTTHDLFGQMMEQIVGNHVIPSVGLG